MANFYCKWCGEKYPGVTFLLNSSCSKSPSKKHELHAGEGASPRQVWDDIFKLHREGWNIEEIAKAFDISKGEVELILEFDSKD
jgi:hypothetical protein